jgi:hypothetical protein
MSAKTLLWHLLLCMGLVLNGSADALSSLAMTHAVGHAQRPVAGHAQCHSADHRGMHAVAQGRDAASQPAGGKQPGSDCCQSMGCSCVAAHQAQIAGAAPVFPGPAIHDVGLHGGSRSRHAEPMLPHLIRPPIG